MGSDHGRRALYAYGRRALHALCVAGLNVRLNIKHGECIMAGGFVRIWPAGLTRIVCSGFKTHHGRRALDVTSGYVKDWQGYVPVGIFLVANSAALVMHVYVAIQSMPIAF